MCQRTKTTECVFSLLEGGDYGSEVSSRANSDLSLHRGDKTLQTHTNLQEEPSEDQGKQKEGW